MIVEYSSRGVRFCLLEYDTGIRVSGRVSRQEHAIEKVRPLRFPAGGTVTVPSARSFYIVIKIIEIDREISSKK